MLTSGVLRNGRGTGQEFLSLFLRAGRNTERAAELLDQMIDDWPESGEAQREILKCEQTGDRITHDILHRLGDVRRTPFHRDEIFALAEAIDDVVDYIEEVADFFGLYRIEAPTEQSQQLATILSEAATELSQALTTLPTLDGVREHLVTIKRLESDGDRVSRDALACLFDRGIDPMVVIRWKDIIDRLEDAIDGCEHAAHVLEGMLVRR